MYTTVYDCTPGTTPMYHDRTRMPTVCAGVATDLYGLSRCPYDCTTVWLRLLHRIQSYIIVYNRTRTVLQSGLSVCNRLFSRQNRYSRTLPIPLRMPTDTPDVTTISPGHSRYYYGCTTIVLRFLPIPPDSICHPDYSRLF